MGTPVRASNSGVVVLRGRSITRQLRDYRPRAGAVSLSMHLSRIQVHEGQRVLPASCWVERSYRARDRASSALGGAVGGAYLDPAKVLRVNLNGIL